jgi:hypothetical protein
MTSVRPIDIEEQKDTGSFVETTKSAKYISCCVCFGMFILITCVLLMLQPVNKKSTNMTNTTIMQMQMHTHS